MKKKILLIILMGICLTFLIYQHNKDDKIYLLSLGDGLASGMTAYRVDGYNYNDYLRDYLEKEKKLEKYVHEFSESGMTVDNLLTSIENNFSLKSSNLTIQQAIAKSDILTLAIGLDELADLSLKQKIPSPQIEEYKNDMTLLAKLIRNFSEEKVFLLSIYKAYNLKEEDITKINKFLKDIAIEQDFIFIDISDLPNNPSYFLLDNSYYLSYKGHQEIYQRILKNL